MKQIKTIIVLIDVYSNFGGASKAADKYFLNLKEKGYESYLICNNSLPGESCPEYVYVINNDKRCHDFIEKHKIDVVHYFKAMKSLKARSLFARFVRTFENVGKKPLTLITICQQPSFPSAILTPFEIKNSDHIIFIDKTAFNDPLYSFIPERHKSWTYLNSSKDELRKKDNNIIKSSYSLTDDTIVFGRGSTLNKCPKDVIEVYDAIRTAHKKRFKIIGVPEKPNWLTEIIQKRGGNDIITYPLQLPVNYEKLVSTFDVLLYYIPEDCYSSRDGSLSTALRVGVPVIVCGAPAPKESIVHGENGYIANSKEELIRYAEVLAKDEVERMRLGRNARKLFFENAPEKNWPERLIDMMNEVINRGERNFIVCCPFKTALHIYIKKYLYWFLSVFTKVYGRMSYSK